MTSDLSSVEDKRKKSVPKKSVELPKYPSSDANDSNLGASVAESGSGSRDIIVEVIDLPGSETSGNQYPQAAVQNGKYFPLKYLFFFQNH